MYMLNATVYDLANYQQSQVFKSILKEAIETSLNSFKTSKSLAVAFVKLEV